MTPDPDVYPDPEEYEPDLSPPYRPVTCLLCGSEEDEPDLWWHFIEEHSEINSEGAWA